MFRGILFCLLAAAMPGVSFAQSAVEASLKKQLRGLSQ
jgi:hypothetical protein